MFNNIIKELTSFLYIQMSWLEKKDFFCEHNFDIWRSLTYERTLIKIGKWLKSIIFLPCILWVSGPSKVHRELFSLLLSPHLWFHRTILCVIPLNKSSVNYDKRIQINGSYRFLYVRFVTEFLILMV